MKDYIKIAKIGEGTYGVVYKGQNKKTGQIVAMKKTRFPPGNLSKPATAIREISILKELQHRNIVSLEDVIMGEKRLYLIFEFLAMDLKKYMDSLGSENFMEPALVKSYLFQITQGMDYCHKKLIIHRDLKPHNLLIDNNGTIKVADFGSGRSVDIPKRMYEYIVVALAYRAPEILLRSNTYSCPIDIWSMGCIFAEMVRKKQLFHEQSEIGQLFKIFRVLKTPTEEIWPGVTSLPLYKPTFPNWTSNILRSQVEQLDDDGKDILEQMLVYDPNNRITAESMLKHPYFYDVDHSIKPKIE